MMDDLFSWSDDKEERARVYSRIAPVILLFHDTHWGGDFHVEELRRFVLGRVPEIAPDSPGRILRELRLRGVLDYIVVNRRQSLYRFCTTEG
jgi:hypothetical protein